VAGKKKPEKKQRGDMADNYERRQAQSGRSEGSSYGSQKARNAEEDLKRSLKPKKKGGR